METSSRLSCTLERAAIPRRFGGLRICMHKNLQGDPFLKITLFTKGYILSIAQYLAN